MAASLINVYYAKESVSNKRGKGGWDLIQSIIVKKHTFPCKIQLENNHQTCHRR